jgi:type VI secretion system protein ImpK
MDRVIEATEAVFNALAHMQRVDANSSSMFELIHQQFSIYIEQAARSAQRLGFTQQDAEDIKYALVAVTDETILQKGGSLREFWLQRVLQLKLFNEQNAGEGFFTRLETLRRDRQRTDILRVYYLCLLFGFRGQYAIRGGQVELQDIIDRVRDELVKAEAIAPELPLSPRGDRPHEPIADARRNMLLVWFSVAAATASLILYVWFKLDLNSQTSRLIERVAALTGA